MLGKNKTRAWSITPNTTTRIVAGLFRSRNFVWDSDSRVAASYGVSWTQFLVLRALRFTKEDFVMSPTELYSATQASSSGMAKMLRGLTEKGLVERLPTQKMPAALSSGSRSKGLTWLKRSSINWSQQTPSFLQTFCQSMIVSNLRNYWNGLAIHLRIARKEADLGLDRIILHSGLELVFCSFVHRSRMRNGRRISQSESFTDNFRRTTTITPPSPAPHSSLCSHP